MKKIAIILSLLLAMSLTMTGCSTEAVTDNASSETSQNESMYAYEGSLKITGTNGDFEVPYNDIYNNYETVTQNVHSISSTGEESDDEVTGVLLDTILADYSISQSDFNAIRLIAGDGYQITVPAEVIKEHDIILAYEFNGEGLEEHKQPLRIAIDGVRSMYFVSNLSEISFSEESAVEVVASKEIFMLETAILSLGSEEYIYYDSTDSAVTVADLLEISGVTSESDLNFVSSDGYEKTETMEIFKEGYIKFTGEDSPMFIDPDLQKGMYIKYIMKVEAGDKTFASVASAMTAFDTIEVNGKTGVPMVDFIEMVGIDASSYVFTATDGYAVEVPSEALADGVLYINEETGSACMKFAEEHPSLWGMKDILTVSPAEGTNTEASVESPEMDAAEWTITIEGLSDGDFDFTSDRAASKITLVELHTEKEKNEEVYPEDWTGYPINEILAWLHVDTYSSLTIVASDGYEVEVPASEIDDESIIAITKNGELLADDIVVQFVQNTQFATTWIKGVAKVVINP